MRSVLLCLGLLFTAGVILVSCYKDVIIPPVPPNSSGPPQFVSYSADLAPLFNSNCAGCHKPGGPHPYLSTDVSYNELINGGFVNTTVPESSILYIEINGNMGSFMPNASDRQKVYDWIRNGAPNN